MKKEKKNIKTDKKIWENKNSFGRLTIILTNKNFRVISYFILLHQNPS